MDTGENKHSSIKIKAGRTISAVLCAAVLFAQIPVYAETGSSATGTAQTEAAGSDANSGTYTEPKVSVTETETTAPRSTSKHTNIRDTVNSRTDTIRSKSSGTAAVTADDGKDSTADPEIYPEKYDMNLKLDTAAKNLSGTVTVRIRNNTHGRLTMLCLRNYAASVLAQNGGKAADAVISTVTDTAGDRLQVNTSRDPSVVYVSLGEHGIASSGTGSFMITFSEKIPKLDDRFGYHQNSDGGLMFQLTYCFPVLAMYADGKWDENPYFYAGETACSPCTDYTAVLSVPKDFVVASTGSAVRKGAAVRINADDVRDMAITACDYMREDSATVSGKKINLFYLTRKNTNGLFRKYVLGAAEDALAMFTELIGDYAYDELDVVEAYLPGGMEYPGLVLINTDAGRKNVSYSDLCELTAHEVGHEWFYAAVGNDQYSEAWLDEGFATYLEQSVYANSASGTLAEAVKYDKSKGVTPVKTWDSSDKYGAYMKNCAAKLGDKYYVNLSYSGYSGDSDYTQHVYDGGGMFLYELSQTMGTAAFDRALRSYYSGYRFKIADTEDFLSVIDKADPTGKTKEVTDRFISR